MKPDRTDSPPPSQQWQGLDQLAGDAAFWEAAANEFPEGASEFTDEVSRRRFIGLMGASLALAGSVGCNLRPAPQRKILPYTVQPDEITPGIPLFFATAATLSGYGSGILVRSHEGRPIKVEGNPDHPSSRGGADSFSLASILDLYDPDRSKGVTHRGLAASPDEAVVAVRTLLADARKKWDAANEEARRKAEEKKDKFAPPGPTLRLRVLTETVTSPTLAARINALFDSVTFPHIDVRWAQHDPAHANARDGLAKAHGAAKNLVYDFTKADVILSLDADFLTGMPGSVRYSRDFAERRKIRQNGKTIAEVHEAKHEDGKKDDHKHDDHGPKEGVQPDALNRLYAVEAMLTCTGSVADHRLALPTSLIESFARALAAELQVKGAPSAGPLPPEATAWLKPLAADLKAKAGKSAVVAGSHLPASVHALVAAINAELKNVGADKPVQVIASPEVRPDGRVIDLKTLTEEMNNRQVDALLIFGVNAAYSAPADVPFAEAMKNVLGLTLHHGLYQDETAVLCEWHVNAAHFLETWGDVRGHDGTASIQQPLIAPLYDGKSPAEFLAAVTAIPTKDPNAKIEARDGYDLVREYWKNTDEVKKAFPAFTNSEPFEVFWQKAVRGGVVPGTAAPVEAEPKLADNWAEGSPSPVPAPTAENGKLEINFRPDPTIYDGRFANNGWLQELPKPATKLTWDNAAFMSMATAEKLGIDKTYFRWTGGEHGRAEVAVVELEFRGRKVKAPVWILPGHADNAVTVHLGYGRPRAGRVNSTPGEPNAAGEPVRGFNAYALRTSDAPWTGTGLTVRTTGENYFLACTQGQWSMVQKDLFIDHDWNRKPVRHGDIDLYNKFPAFAKITPAASGETELISQNVPGPAEPDPHSGAQGRQGTAFPGLGNAHDHSHDHKDAEKNGHGEHDRRLAPLTMYEPNDNLYPNLPEGQRRRWAMAIDLNACTGCSACVTACVGENNIPVVGKDQVTKGRIMHWINVDRYYEGDPADTASLKVLFQPRMCVQCEKAPCEIVCPVGATVHSADGLNDMVYNRCVGTRYCSNNCPYKVRRFNFLTYADWHTNSLKLGRNPDVSVRSRGVMEKCTFCVQRIRYAEIVAEREHRKIRDGEILTACQSACPSGAIVFGDLNDAGSAVSRWKREPRNYGLLAELNTMPRLTHLAIVRNPNPAMPNTPKGA